MTNVIALFQHWLIVPGKLYCELLLQQVSPSVQVGILGQLHSLFQGRPLMHFFLEVWKEQLFGTWFWLVEKYVNILIFDTFLLVCPAGSHSHSVPDRVKSLIMWRLLFSLQCIHIYWWKKHGNMLPREVVLYPPFEVFMFILDKTLRSWVWSHSDPALRRRLD